MLYVFEELFLFALDDKKGNIYPFMKKKLAYGLPGAILTDLAFENRICSNEKHRLEILSPNPTGDPLLDDVLETLVDSEKTRKTAYWISQLSEQPKKQRENVAEGLVRKNILSQDDKHFFRIHPSNSNPQIDVPDKYRMKEQLRGLILTGGYSDPRSLALLNMLAAINLLDLVFTVDELDFARQSIHEKLLSAAMSNPILQTIEEIEQAVSVTIEEELD